MSDNEEITVRHDRAEIHFTDDRDPGPRDDVAILSNGWVKAVIPGQYQVEYYSPDKIRTIHTHTSADPLTDEEEIRG